jgi:hypothetical protein
MFSEVRLLKPLEDEYQPAEKTFGRLGYRRIHVQVRPEEWQVSARRGVEAVSSDRPAIK